MVNREVVETWVSERQYQNSVYFKDNIRKIDAIIVFKMSEWCEHLETFLKNLRVIGFHLEFAPSVQDNNIIYGKIFAPDHLLIKYAERYNMVLRKDQTLKFRHAVVPFHCLETILTTAKPDPNDDVSLRAWKTVSREHPTEITFSERSVIVFAALDYIRFGATNFEVGLQQLLHRDIILAAYPLHDGEWEWPESKEAPLNDRQLLARYWADFGMIFKQQPIHAIEKYYGYEIAIYFAWISFYNKMLMYASFGGIFTFFCGIFFILYVNKDEIALHCDEKFKVHMPKDPNHITTNDLKQESFLTYCVHVHIGYMFSNVGTFVYSWMIIIWCIVFKELWKRKLYYLNTKWAKVASEDFVLRPQFIATAKNVRRHKYTGELEVYLTFYEKFTRYSVSMLCQLIMLGIILASLYLIIVIEGYLKSKNVSRPFIAIILSIVSVIMMTITEKMIYDYLVVVLTKLEMPRTELDYEKSIIIKDTIFAILNSYGRLFFISFFKRHFPRPPMLDRICMLPGCVLEVVFLLLTILFFKPWFDNLVEVQRPFFFVIWRKFCKGSLKFTNLPRWERDHDKNKLGSTLGELQEMIIQFGFVSFFAVCCPLAPAFALIHNLIEIRVDAVKITKYHQRPVERKQICSINLLFDLFEAFTLVAIVFNAFLSAYTANVSYIFYHIFYEPYKDNLFYYFYFVSNIYTEYQYIASYAVLIRARNIINACLILIYIIVGFTISAAVSYIIPDEPRALREYIIYHEKERKRQQASIIK